MSISELSSRRNPAVLLADAVASVRWATETIAAAQSDEDLVAVVELAAELRAATAVVQADAVAEADARDLARQTLHYGSTGDWLTHTGGLPKGAGRRLVARAHALTGPLAGTREALAAGRVSPEQAEVIVKAIETLPLGEAVRARGQAALLEHAGTLDASDLAKTGRHLVHVVDPEGIDRRLEAQLAREERGCHLDRHLRISSDGAGGVRVQGRGSAEDGALLKAALLPLTAPAPAVDDHDGHDTTQVHDPRDHGARMWDALIQTAQHALDTDLPPDSHGAPPRLLVTIGLEDLKAALATGLADTAVTGLVGAGRVGVGVSGDGTELSASTIRRLACDAEIIPTVLGRHGEPLDVGRSKRLVTVAIWLALVVRDQHCAFPGCDRPPLMCHAHHILPWILGGETKLENLVLLCAHHHRVVHDTPWHVRLNLHDHKPEFRPPPKPGVQPTWIRHRPRRQ
jgi:Domain of unknown function (DUF222)/HNH endonuclease